MSLNNPMKKNDLLAYTCAFAAQAFFPLSNIYAIEHDFSSYEINLMRSTLVIFYTLAYARYTNIDLDYPLRNSFKIITVRNIMMVTWVSCMTMTYYYLSFAVINSINICGSLLVFVWDAYIYDMHINRNQKIGVALGLIGAIVIINAGYFLSMVDETYSMKTDFEFFKSTSVFDTVLAASILFLSIIGMGFGYSITKSIKIQKSGSEYNLQFGFILFLFASIGMMLDKGRPVR
jgi:drug/metabolite transporter (DMT)-like permease